MKKKDIPDEKLDKTVCRGGLLSKTLMRMKLYQTVKRVHEKKQRRFRFAKPCVRI